MTDNDNPTKGTKESIAYKIANGQIHKCGCGKLIGDEYRSCGECENKQKMKKAAFENGVKDGVRPEKAYMKGIKLSAEAKANIARANRAKAQNLTEK